MMFIFLCHYPKFISHWMILFVPFLLKIHFLSLVSSLMGRVGEFFFLFSTLLFLFFFYPPLTSSRFFSSPHLSNFSWLRLLSLLFTILNDHLFFLYLFSPKKNVGFSLSLIIHLGWFYWYEYFFFLFSFFNSFLIITFFFFKRSLLNNFFLSFFYRFLFFFFSTFFYLFLSTSCLFLLFFHFSYYYFYPFLFLHFLSF